MNNQYQEVRKARRILNRFGLGLNCRVSPYTGEYGFIVTNLDNNTCVGGGYPIPYCWTLEDVNDYIAELNS